MNIQRVTVVGAGMMGSGIAQRLALGSYDTVLHDTSTEAVERSLDTILNGPFGLRAAVTRELIDETASDEAFGRIRTEQDLAAACTDADLVIEAVYEDLAIKIRLFRTLDEVCPERTILASNTSGFPIDALAAATSRPHKVIGWHFASPVPVMRLAEIALHPETAADTRDSVVEVARRIDVNPEVIQDDPFHWGFVANRILFAVIREAEAIVTDGVATDDQVDRIVKDCYRWPVGPFEMFAGIEGHHYYAGTDPNNPPPTMSAAYHVAARTRRGVS